MKNYDIIIQFRGESFPHFYTVTERTIVSAVVSLFVQIKLDQNTVEKMIIIPK